MQRTSAIWAIDGMHPAEYAAQWGYGNHGEGAMFYNCCAQCPVTGGVCSNPDWDREDWLEFEKLARERAAGVSRAVRSGKGSGWTMDDANNLSRLADWAVYMAHRDSSTSPWLKRTV
jgi:hypothetical protein